MNLSINGPKILFKIPVGDLFTITITETALASFVVTWGLILACYLLGKNLKKHPDGRQVIVEKLVMMLYNMVEDTMGSHDMHYAPYIGALFLSSLFGSLISVTGFFRSSTADLSTTATWAIMTIVIVWASNIREQGLLNWLKGFTEPIFIMTPMNIVSEFATPVSMAFRHFGNVMGGSVLTTLIYAALALASNALFGWLPGFLGSIPFLQVGIPAAFSVYFDFFSGGIQALVFCMLSMVYIGMANPPRDEFGRTAYQAEKAAKKAAKIQKKAQN
jgi:F-type H+-transporting ATPase subunit a